MLCGKVESYNNKTNSNVNQLSIGYFSPKNKHCPQKRLINLCHPLKWGETRNARRKNSLFTKMDGFISIIVFLYMMFLETLLSLFPL